MTGPIRKKLIEVAIPLAAINEASAREKSIRHGHPSTLHLWWARRPLAACRAALFAQFVDDPSSVPEEFPDEAAQEAERKRLFGIIERLVPWKNSNDEHVIRDARREIARSVARSRGDVPPGDGQIDSYLAANAPPVVDPFCGGGSIPLEAQRLGLRAHGSDLNPVAVLITKAMVEIPPRFWGRPPVNPASRDSFTGSWATNGASGLAEDVRYYGEWVRAEAEKRIGHLYPKVEVTPEMVRERPDLKSEVGRQLTVIAWLWARTVASPNPAVGGAHVPLVRSFVLSSKRGKEAWVEPVKDQTGDYQFHVQSGNGLPPNGTIGRRGGQCLLTGEPIPLPHIRAEGRAGRMGTRLMAVVTEGSRGRVYLDPTKDVEHVARVDTRVDHLNQKLPHNPRDFKTPNYGMATFGDLFTPRQLVALTTFADLVAEVSALVKRDWLAMVRPQRNDGVALADGGAGAQAYADAVVTYLAFAADKAADYWSGICSWHSSGEFIRNTFARQAIPMVWDYAETNPFSNSTGNWMACVRWVSLALRATPRASLASSVCQRDAAATELPATAIVATDPPYYDNIGYADLSDFFYVWLRRSLGTVHGDLFRTLLSPKADELVATPYRFNGDRGRARRFFEGGLGNAVSRMRSAQASHFPMTLFYAYKQAETVTGAGVDGSTASTGWETMLQGIVHNGFAITGTWPIRSELGNRMLAAGTNALASSIVISCRPRSSKAGVASRREFAAELRDELPLAIRQLQAENIAPVDLAQAAIGPGMAVYSRHAQVVAADGEPMSVREALAEINRVLDETLNEVEGEMDTDTRFCVAWFEQYGLDERPYGEAEVLFTAKGVAFEGLESAGVLVGGGGRVRLKRRDELDSDWDPATDRRMADWECVQHLARAMSDESGGGISEAARLAVAMGPARAETARSLAYRLHAASERKGWSTEALAYNVLVSSWPQIQSAMVQLREGQQTQLPV